MTSLNDAYAVLGLSADAEFPVVYLRYKEICNGPKPRNMPAIHHCFKMILEELQHKLGIANVDESDESDYDDYDNDIFVDSRDYYSGGGGFYSPLEYNMGCDQLRESKFSRVRQRPDEGYRANTDGEAVREAASSLLREEAQQQETIKSESKKSKKKKKNKKKKKSANSENISTISSNNNCCDTRNENNPSSDSDGEGLDLNSAFAKASAKAAAADKPGVANGHKESKRPSGRPIGAQGRVSSAREPLDVVREQAQRIALDGNKQAGKGDFSQAARTFSYAIKLDPDDHRFFGNRSFCFDQLHQYDRALKDAERAIQIEPNWPKGHFRKGRALLGQQQYHEAEAAFRLVLELDKNATDCHREIEKTVVYRLMTMGFTKERSRAAIRQFSTEEAALDALLRGDVRDEPEDSSESDDDTGEPTPGRPANPKEDPSNVEGLTSLWVGNVMPSVTERELNTLFAKHGAVTSVRVLPERFCAFINFYDKKGASLAMQHLQGLDFHGKQLKIKFPDNPILQGQQKNLVIGKKPLPTPPPPPAVAKPPPPVVNYNNSSVPPRFRTGSAPPKAKQTGPVADGECYFWRTLGCHFGSSCKNKHIPAHKGIDRRSHQQRH